MVVKSVVIKVVKSVVIKVVKSVVIKVVKSVVIMKRPNAVSNYYTLLNSLLP